MARSRVASALLTLPVVFRSGQLFRAAPGARRLYRKLVRIRRGWSYHLVYEIRGDELLVLFIDPSWRRRYRGR